jgi:hypothetical protein
MASRPLGAVHFKLDRRLAKYGLFLSWRADLKEEQRTTQE